MLKLLLENKLVGIFGNIKNNRRNKFIFIAVMLLIITLIFSCYFVSTNEKFYNKPIAKITSITEVNSQMKDMNGKVEQIKQQNIKAIIMNGIYKGKEIQLQNTTSYSQVNDLNLKVNDEVFISTQENGNKELASCKILNLKRDRYFTSIIILFVLLILLIGGFKGFRSLVSVSINIMIFTIIIELFAYGYNLIVISIIASILFIGLSIAIVCGVNNKMVSAIIATVVGTVISMLIAVAVIYMNHWNGAHFEEMDYLTHPPEEIFIIEILIGTLGAIMDIAISISSSINEIYNKNPNIEKSILINSGREIGKDIMATMANTLAFAYVSGSIPIILLLFRNGYPISYIFNINLSLEIIRALTGSIGIVLSIPITIYTSVITLRIYRIGEI